jgi:Histidinol-phosphate/aromatic aminotransferase and cobyric acid decarboxylase
LSFHGSVVWDGSRPRSLKDFSYTVNPLGAPDFVKKLVEEAVQLQVYSLYPPNDYGYLESLLADYVGSGKVTVLNGTSEVFPLLPPCNVPEPNYSSYRRTSSYPAELVGREWKYELKGECVVTSNPVNPTGACIDRRELVRFLREGGVLILDESFVELSDCESFVNLVDEFPNLLVLRSFTKSLAVPGLRIGYAVHSKRKEWDFLRYLPEWRVNSVVYYVFSNLNYSEVRRFLEKSREVVRSIRSEMTTLFRAFVSYAPYVVVELKVDSVSANDKLLRLGFYVRDHRGFRNFKKEWARVAVRQDYRELYDALKSSDLI